MSYGLQNMIGNQLEGKVIVSEPNGTIKGAEMPTSTARPLTFEVQTLAPVTWKAYEEYFTSSAYDQYDLVLHLGNVPDTDKVMLEVGSKRLGYGKILITSDSTEKPSHEEGGKFGFKGDKDNYYTNVNIDQLAEYLKGKGFEVHNYLPV
jgi:hypothetical protein